MTFGQDGLSRADADKSGINKLYISAQHSAAEEAQLTLEYVCSN